MISCINCGKHRWVKRIVYYKEYPVDVEKEYQAEERNLKYDEKEIMECWECGTPMINKKDN